MAKPQVQCPNCKSFKVASVRLIGFAFGLGLMVVGGMLSIILVGIPIMLIGFILLIVSFFLKKNSFTCQNCQYRFETAK